MNLPEPIRAWCWWAAHTTRNLTIGVAAALWLLGFIWTAAWALTGHGSWLPPLGLVLGAVPVVTTVQWLRAGKTRP